jgi:hypothetical protein
MMAREELEIHQIWASQLETYGCTQLSSGLRESSGIGQQIESLGSLNGYYLDNPYVRAVGALVDGGLQGIGPEEARRTVDIAFGAAGLLSNVDQGERDVLTYLLIEDQLDVWP